MNRWLLAAIVLPLNVFAQAPTPSLFEEGVTLFKKGDYDGARVLFETVVAQDPRNQPAQNYLRMITVREKNPGAGTLEANLRKIIIPKVSMQDTSVQEAVAYVAQRVRELTQGKQSVNIVWQGAAETSTIPVTLSLQNIPASEALRYITDAAGLKISYDQQAATISPARP